MAIKHYLLIPIFFFPFSFASSKETAQSLSYAGIDPAEVLSTLYYGSRPGPDSEAIVTALQVDLDSLTLDFFRIELVNHAHTLPDGKTCATINNLWGNTIEVTFDISAQVLVLRETTPIDREWVKEALQKLKSCANKSEETYQQHSTDLYNTWIAPLAYTKQIIYHWFSPDPLPKYESKEQDYIISSILNGVYNPNDAYARECALITLRGNQLKAFTNEFRARELYKKGSSHANTASRAITTPLRETAKRASTLAMTAAIERIIYSKANRELEAELASIENTLSLQKQQEEYLQQGIDRHNRTQGRHGAYTMKRAAY